MLKSIVDYVKYHYQFCENIEPFYLTNNLDTNECYIKSCLVFKYLFEYYFRKNEIMSLMDITDFLFITNSPVLKSHLIFHHAFKTFWKKLKKGRYNIYVFDTTLKSSILGFVTGVLYWFFNFFIQILYKIIESFGNDHTIHHKTSIFFQKDEVEFCLLWIYHIHLILF